jgi:hypothetical protein
MIDRNQTGVWLDDDGTLCKPDPSNLRRYVGNSPTNATDPTGLFADPTQKDEKVQPASETALKELPGAPKTVNPSAFSVTSAEFMGGVGVTDSPDEKSPRIWQVYTRGSLLKVDVEFAQKGKELKEKVDVIGVMTATSDGKERFLGSAVTHGAAVTDNTLKLQMQWHFPKLVDCYDPLKISWFISPEYYGNKWQSAGTSEKKIYLTYAEPQDLPAGNPLMQTFVAYGCRGKANGPKDNPEAVLQAIWSNFAEKKATNADGKALGYWLDWRNNITGPGSAQRLVREGDGQCEAWAELLLSAIYAQGLTRDNALGTVRLEAIIPSRKTYPNAYLIINTGWTPKEKNKDDDLFVKLLYNPRYKGNEDKVYVKKAGKWVYNWQGREGTTEVGPELSYSPDDTLKAQNNANPRAEFPNHAIVLIGNKIYDPSYGVIYTGANDGLSAFQEKAVWGIAESAKTVSEPEKWNLRIHRVKGPTPLVIQFVSEPTPSK